MGHNPNQSTNLEIITRSIDLIRSDNGQKYFSGYAVVFYDGTDATTYRPLPNVQERIQRGAVDLSAYDDVEAWYNHSPDYVLGSTSKGSLYLSVDNRGLKFTLPFDEADPDHNKVAVKLSKGIATGCSWQAMAEYKLRKEGETYIRDVHKIHNLKEISIVNNPAYKSAHVSLRSDLDQYDKTQQFLKRHRIHN